MTNLMWVMFIAIVVGLGLVHFREVASQVNQGFSAIDQGLRQL